MTQAWRTVAVRERVWSGTNRTHKMGWAWQGQRVRVVEEWNNWSRFDRYSGEGNILAHSSGYPEWWILTIALGEDLGVPGPVVPPPIPVWDTDAEIGAALRTLVRAVRDIWRA